MKEVQSSEFRVQNDERRVPGEDLVLSAECRVPKTPVKLMGILNITPDSFSDGGKFLDPHAAVARAEQMISEAAEIIDVGAESTRPGSYGVGAEEQLARILPILHRAGTDAGGPRVSVDTRSARVAEACLDAGARAINDVSALRHDSEMIRVLVKYKHANVILMHMQGTPETMQRDPAYRAVVGDIVEFFRERIEVCLQAGISRERIWIDPGFGFGKTFEHNLELMRRFEEFKALGQTIVAGVSRKSFLGKLTGESDPAKRDVASIAAGLKLAECGANVLRVHDVAGHAQALKVFDAI